MVFDPLGIATTVLQNADATYSRLLVCRLDLSGSPQKTCVNFATDPSLGADGGNPLAVDIALAGTNDVVAVWVKDTDAGTAARAGLIVHTDAGPTLWDGGVTFETGGSANQPRVAADTAGNALAVWLDRDGGNSAWGSSMVASSNTWSAPTALVPVGVAKPNRPQVVFLSGGDGLITWSSRVSSFVPYEMHAVRYSAADAGFSIFEVLASDNGSFDDPDLAADRAGNAMFVFAHLHDAGAPVRFGDLMFTRYVGATKTWSAPAVVDAIAEQVIADPSVAFHPSGDAIVTWAQSNAGAPYVVLSSWFFADGGAWSKPALVYGDAASDAGAGDLTPNVVFGADGKPFVVWRRIIADAGSLLWNRCN